MKDQNSIREDENKSIKYDRALALFTESVMKPDPHLRGCAHNQHCYEELMEIRNEVLDYLRNYKKIKKDRNLMDEKTMQFYRDNIPSRY